MKSFRSRARRSNPEPGQLVRLFQSETAEIREAPEPKGIRATLYLLAGFMVTLVALAFIVRIDRVVTSTAGAIVTHDPTVVVQALDQSIVKTLDVQVGQRVKAGQLLATLDPTFATADVRSLVLQIAGLDAQIARCEAELAHRQYQPAPINDAAIAKYGQAQLAYYEQRKAQYDQQLRAYDETIAQAKATMVKYTTDAARYGDRTKLAKEVEDMRATLAAAQVGSRLNLLAATDAKTELLRNLEYDQNALAETQHQLEAAVANRDAFVQQWLGQASQELVTARTQRDTAQQQLDKATKHKDLVRLETPDDAIVLTKGNGSVGSVLNAGDMLFTLAPMRSPLEADLQVSTTDVGFIRVGDPVTIKLDTFNFIEHGSLEGVVRWVSEGAFMPGSNGNVGSTGAPASLTYGSTPNIPQTASSSSGMTSSPYYEVRVALNNVSLRDVPKDFRLIPGMTLSGDIHIGTRSIASYITIGALRGVGEAMREP